MRMMAEAGRKSVRLGARFVLLPQSLQRARAGAQLGATAVCSLLCSPALPLPLSPHSPPLPHHLAPLSPVISH
jgi:hypothetical protein